MQPPKPRTFKGQEIMEARVPRSYFILCALAAGLTRCNTRTAANNIQYSILAQRFPSPHADYEIAPDTALPAASIVKLLVAIALIERGAVGTNTAVLESSAFSAMNRYFLEQSIGEHIPVRMLLQHMIEQSDNFSSNVLIAHLGPLSINAVAKRLDLTTTRIHGLFRDAEAPLTPRGYTTARDCNKMLGFILGSARNAGVDRNRTKWYRRLIEMMVRQHDRRFIPLAAPPGAEVADKTGEIHGEINDAAIIQPFGPSPILLTILSHGKFSIYGDPSEYQDVVAAVRNKAREIFVHLHRDAPAQAH
jgi:beta-lactamase class A